jgi:hypothetical protein
VGNYSLGAVYLIILNLPRHLRYKKENMIVVCLLPGGSEKLHDMSKLLKPMVDELLQLWRGVSIMTPHGDEMTRVVRGILILVSCDLPAGRKTCGFKSANCCCSKCTFAFEHYDTGNPRKDQTGNIYSYNVCSSDYKSWVERSGDEVHRLGLEYLQCASKAEQTRFVSEHHVRYSALFQLPYFDPVTMLCIDPMHNLWLGVTHNLVELFKEKGFLKDKQLAEMQDYINKIGANRKYGRMRSKIESNMSRFTAEVPDSCFWLLCAVFCTTCYFVSVVLFLVCRSGRSLHWFILVWFSRTACPKIII